MQIRLLDRDTVAVTAPFALKDKLKAIPTARWNRDAKAWVFARTEPVLDELRKLGTVPAEVDLERLTGVEIVRVKDPAPWPHQLEMSQRVLKRAGYVHGGMGVGKSRAVVDAVVNARLARVLILCPTSVVRVWEVQFERWADAPIDVMCLDGGATTARAKRVTTRIAAAAIDGSQVVIVCNYEAAWRPAMAEAFKSIKWDLVVADECHRLKAPTGKAARFAADLRKTSKRVVGMSGTPMPHSPLDVFSQFRAIDPGVFGESLTKFRAKYENSGFVVRPVKELPPHHGDAVNQIIAGERTYPSTFARFMGVAASCMRCGATDQEIVDTISYVCAALHMPPPYLSQMITVIKQVRKTNVWRNLDDLKERMDTITLHVDRSVLTLPPSLDVQRYVTLSAEERRAHDDMMDRLSTAVKDGTVTARNALTKLLRMQQITGGFVAVDDEGSDVSRLRDIGDSRRAALEEILEDIGADEPVVVFCRFWRDIDNVGLASQKVSGRRALELSGRKKELDEWQKPDAPPVLAVQIQTGGLGVDLTRACYCVYYSIGYSLGDLEQAKARTHRPGQTRPVTHIQMIARGTIDSMIWRAIDEKRDVIESILGEVR